MIDNFVGGYLNFLVDYPDEATASVDPKKSRISTLQRCGCMTTIRGDYG